jgi:hypothetical protein
MSRESVLVLLGVIVALSPFLGIPTTWLAIILPLLGVAVAVIGASLRVARFFATESPHDAPHS